MYRSRFIGICSGLLFLTGMFYVSELYGQEGHRFSATVDSLMHACLMARQSLETGNAGKMIHAAQMISKIGPSPSPADRYKQGGEGELPEPRLKYEPAWLLKRAQRLDQEMKELEKLYADSELESLLATLRGNGDNFHVTMFNTMLRPLAEDEYQISFTADEMAEVVVIGDGNTSLTLFVYDLNGKPVAGDEKGGVDCMVAWKPDRTQIYVIKIINRGKEFNSYTLLTN